MMKSTMLQSMRAVRLGATEQWKRQAGRGSYDANDASNVVDDNDDAGGVGTY